MEGLASYGSDDEYEESPKMHKEIQEKYGRGYGAAQKSTDVNYDEVGMDLSEDSDRSEKARSPDRKAGHHSPKNSRRRRSDDEDDSYKYQNKQSKDRDDSKYKSKRFENYERIDKHRDYEERTKDRSYEESHKDRDDKYKDRQENYKDYDDKYKNRDDRYKERDDKYRDYDSRSKDRDDGRHRDRNDKYRGKEREDRSRYRDDRRSRRSNSRDKGRSRSPRRNRRSGSRERGGKYSRRFDKASNKMAHLEKMGIDLKTDGSSKYEDEPKGAGGENKFFLPGISGRLREQMERRKLLWQKKEPEQAAPAPSTVVESSGSKTGKVWEATTFAQDQDGKQASKFKRLMGIKDSSGASGKPPSDIVKKQEELFSTMEQQYEVARTATHTMRGVGLGFGSFQR